MQLLPSTCMASTCMYRLSCSCALSRVSLDNLISTTMPLIDLNVFQGDLLVHVNSLSANQSRSLSSNNLTPDSPSKEPK